MRILFVTPYVPSRIRVRPFNLIKSLAREHDISLVSLLVEDYECGMLKDIATLCTSIDLVPLPKWSAYKNCLLALPTLMPLRVAYYHSAALVQRMKVVLEREHIDLVHGELIKVVPALKALLSEKNIPVVYDSVDCISWFLQQRRDTERNWLRRLFVSSELYKMRRYEKNSLQVFDHIIITTSSEREHLSQLTGRRNHIQVISNGVDTDYYTPWTGPRQEKTLVFCAKLDYFPNAQAMLYFCQHILPLVWKQDPNVRLTIVGNHPPSSVQALEADPRITITGYVSDIRPYLGQATIALAPLLVAAGIQSKILEALAMGTPVVATQRCSRILGLQHNVHILEAEQPEDFADAVVKLLNDHQLRQQFGVTGRHFVVNHYSWTKAATTLSQLYHNVVDARHPDTLVPVASLDQHIQRP